MYRVRKGLTQRGLAKVAGVKSAAMISHYETGKFDPSPETLAKLAEALGVTPYDLHYCDEVLARRRAVEQTVDEYVTA